MPYHYVIINNCQLFIISCEVIIMTDTSREDFDNVDNQEVDDNKALKQKIIIGIIIAVIIVLVVLSFL